MTLNEFLHIISGPLIGATIGYITNYIAIKMLFRPTKPVYIGKFHVPFTPGIVPRRKDALAEVLGASIVKKFFNADDLEIIFSSDYLRDSFADGIVDMLYSDKANLEKLLEAISDYDPSSSEKDHANSTIYKIKEEICIRVLAGLLKSDLLNSLPGPIAKKLEKYLLTDGKNIVMPLLDEEFDELTKQPISNLLELITDDKKTVHKVVADAYSKFMKVNVRSIVETIDVGGMITEKIKLMDAADVEELVLDVVKRELRYVIWLGALLGLVIGTVNIFI